MIEWLFTYSNKNFIPGIENGGKSFHASNIIQQAKILVSMVEGKKHQNHPVLQTLSSACE